jgi:hypothetical protein
MALQGPAICNNPFFAESRAVPSFYRWSEQSAAGPIPLADIAQAQSQLSRVCSDTLCGRYESNYLASVLVLGLRSAPFYGITHIVEYKDCDGRHALPLFGTKRFVQWLPRLGESIQIG